MDPELYDADHVERCGVVLVSGGELCAEELVTDGAGQQLGCPVHDTPWPDWAVSP